MARVVALVPDLLFGSQVQGMLAAAGNEVELVGDEHRVRDLLGDAAAPAVAVLVVDLTTATDVLDGAALVQALSAEGALAQTRTLGFYAHVDVSVRERAEQTGFDLVVPRSRMAREGAALVASLAGDA
jgi:DNA-binding NarL/FixJ family response regulator